MVQEKPILIIEDDEDTSQLLRTLFEQEGYRSEHTVNGVTGIERALSGAYSLVLLGLGTRHPGGLEICRHIRAHESNLPIIILTSRASEIDKVLGLESGADDYVTKPFGKYELMARIRIQLRKAAALRSVLPPSNPLHTGELLCFGRLKIDMMRRRVTLGDIAIELTVKEYDLLAFLARHAGRPFTREEIIESVWNSSAMGYADTVGSVILRIRRKLKRDATDPEFVLTVRGIGYRFVEAYELDLESSLVRADEKSFTHGVPGNGISVTELPASDFADS